MIEDSKIPMPPRIPGKIYPLVCIVRLVKDPPDIMSRLHVNWLSKIDEPVYNIPGSYEWYKKMVICHGYILKNGLIE